MRGGIEESICTLSSEPSVSGILPNWFLVDRFSCMFVQIAISSSTCRSPYLCKNDRTCFSPEQKPAPSHTVTAATFLTSTWMPVVVPGNGQDQLFLWFPFLGYGTPCTEECFISVAGCENAGEIVETQRFSRLPSHFTCFSPQYNTCKTAGPLFNWFQN